jgi:hypothetical protein
MPSQKQMLKKINTKFPLNMVNNNKKNEKINDELGTFVDQLH